MVLAKDVSDRLARDVDRVVRYLLPHGKMEGGNWCVGSTAGEKGDSMRIQVSGSKAGVWADFAGSEKGDLLDLWKHVKNISLVQAIKEAKQWLGIVDPSASNPKRSYSKPYFPKNVTKTWGSPVVSAAEKYLTEERKLSKETLVAFSVVEYEYPGVGKTMVFPSRSADSKEWLSLKYIGVERKWNADKKRYDKIVISGTVDEPGKKSNTDKPPQYPILFGWQALDKDTRAVVICEGQIDAMTWHQWGVPALSVPNGCKGEATWIDQEWDNLLRFDVIYISFDMDEPGRQGSEMVAKRLGNHRCMIVKLPHNDANECLQKGFGGGDAAKWLMEAKPIAPKEIRQPIEFENEIREAENPDPNVQKPGMEFPVLGNQIRFLPGEVTIWTGHSFHGKSTLLNQFALHAAIEGQGVAIGSFEMKGSVTCANLVKCLTFKADIIPVLKEGLTWLSGKIWIFDIIGFISQPKLKELMLYSTMRHGVKHVIIDSLMKCDLSCEDYDAQRKFFNEFGAFAHEYGIHVHIVAHPRKGDHDVIPDINDIHGGQAIGGQVHNIISVWRNIKKSDGKLKGEEAARVADAGAYIRKNRTGGDRYNVPLWYHRGCHRFTSKAEEEPYYENYNIIKGETNATT
jgi:twinkle protein